MTDCRYCPEGCAVGRGKCHCGCGKDANVATRNQPKYGYVVGEPYKHLAGHSFKRAKAPEGMWFCAECEEFKNSDQFYAGSNPAAPETLHPYCIPCAAIRNARHYQTVKSDPAAWRALQERAFSKKYGITMDEYDAKWDEQSGVCGICQRPQSFYDKAGQLASLSVDHCHESGEFRGLLCRPCNLGLGSFRDNPAALRAAADYLENHLARTEGD